MAVDVRASAGPAVAGMYEGSTPLHCAVRRGLVAAVEVLVRELGADPHARDARGRAPYDLAVALAAASASRRGSAHMSNHHSRGGGGGAGGRGGGADADPGMLALEEVPLELADSEDASHSSNSADHALRTHGTAGATPPVSAETQRKSMLMGTADVALGLGLSSADEIDGGRLPEEKALAVLQAFLRLLHEPLLLRGGGDSASSLQNGGVSSVRMSSSALSVSAKELTSPQPSSVAAPPPVAAAAGVSGALETVGAVAAPAVAAGGGIDVGHRSAQAEAEAAAEAAAIAVALAGEGVMMMAPVPVEWGTRAGDSRRDTAAAVQQPGAAVVMAAAEAAAEAAMMVDGNKGGGARAAAPSSDLLQVLSSTTIPAAASASGSRTAAAAQATSPRPLAAEATAAQPAAAPAAAAGAAASPPPAAKGARKVPATSGAGSHAHVNEFATKAPSKAGSVGGAASRDVSVHRTSAASAASAASQGRNSHTGGGAAPANGSASVSGASDGAPSLALAFLASQLAAPPPAPPPPPPAPAASATRASPFGPAKGKAARPSPFQPKASPFKPKASPFTPKQGTPPARRTSRDTSTHSKEPSGHGSRASSPLADGTLAAAVAAPAVAGGTAEMKALTAAAGSAGGASHLIHLPGVAAEPPQQPPLGQAAPGIAPPAPPAAAVTAAVAPATVPSPGVSAAPSEAAVLPSGSGSLPPSASCAGPAHAGPVCVISPINNPVGYSALNRAILTKRHALVDALLATLPSTGLSFGGAATPEVVVLAPPVPSRRPTAGAYGAMPHSAPLGGASGGVLPALAGSRVTTGGLTAAGGREPDLVHGMPSGASVSHMHGSHGPVAHVSFLHQRTLDSSKSQSTASLAPAATAGASGSGVGSGAVADGAGTQQGRVSHSSLGHVPSGGAGLHRHHTPSPLSLPPGAHASQVPGAAQPHLNASQHGVHHPHHAHHTHHTVLYDSSRYPLSPSTVSNAGSGGASAAPHGHAHAHGHLPGSGALTSRQTSSPFATIAGQPSGLSSSIPTGMLTSYPAAALAPPPPLLPLCVPGPSGPVLSCHLPPPSCHSALVPGLLEWDEGHDSFRALPASQAGLRLWLHWPGEPDPATGWLLAELEVMDAGGCLALQCWGCERAGLRGWAGDRHGLWVGAWVSCSTCCARVSPFLQAHRTATSGLAWVPRPSHCAACAVVSAAPAAAWQLPTPRSPPSRPPPLSCRLRPPPPRLWRQRCFAPAPPTRPFQRCSRKCPCQPTPPPQRRRPAPAPSRPPPPRRRAPSWTTRSRTWCASATAWRSAAACRRRPCLAWAVRRARRAWRRAAVTPCRCFGTAPAARLCSA